MKTSAVLIAIVVASVMGFAFTSNGSLAAMFSSIERVEIDKAIALVSNEKHKQLLRDFKTQHGPEDSIVVTSHFSEFEIIVSHADSDEYTGGTEQYFLNKKSGATRMGWHESPMPLRKKK